MSSTNAAMGSSSTKSAPTRNTHQPQPPRDALTRVFNTALVSTRSTSKRDFSGELYELTESASFKAILNAVRHLARVQGVGERQAAELVIQTFRKMDEIWGEYVMREGLEKLRGPKR